MRHPDGPAVTSNVHLLLAYVADLELEVDRLRKQARFVHHEVKATLARVVALCDPGADRPLEGIRAAAGELAEALRDLREPAGYHPAHDQVIAIAVRPLAAQVFRWQQRVAGAQNVALQLELESEHVDWFPARLRHIFDNLFADALRCREPGRADAWVRLGLRVTAEGYEVRVAHNGGGPPPGDRRRESELFYRAAPAREAGLGAGLAVVAMLVEQGGGSLTAEPGGALVARLPRYEIDDYLERGGA